VANQKHDWEHTMSSHPAPQSLPKRGGSLHRRRIQPPARLRPALALAALFALVGSFSGFASAGGRTEAAERGVIKSPYTVASGPYTLVDPPGRVWVDEDGMLHVHGFSGVGPMAGDFGGTIFLTQYEDIDTATGEGEYRGSFVWETTIDGRSGYFEAPTTVRSTASPERSSAVNTLTSSGWLRAREASRG
jgi:hypothetical protein